MIAPLDRFREQARRLVLPLVLVLAAALVTTGLHHHRDDGPRHACAVCVAGHAPALSTASAATTPKPAPLDERITAVTLVAPRDVDHALASSRAPPSA